MRRLVGIAVTVLVLGAGCTGGGEPTAGASGAPTAGASGGGAPGGGSAPQAGGNAAEVCAAATNASGQSVTTFISELGKMLTAAGNGDTKAAQTAERNAQRALDSWAAAMREQSARATDGRLKAVLAEIGAEVDTLKADIDSVDDAKLDDLQQRLDELCGG